MTNCIKPTPQQIKDARKAAKMTQEAAGKLICVTGRAFRQYEAGDRSMASGLWELFNIKVKSSAPSIASKIPPSK